MVISRAALPRFVKRVTEAAFCRREPKAEMATAELRAIDVVDVIG